MENIKSFISDINKTENISLEKKISIFEKKLCKCFKLYEDNVGFEDFKMTELDYLILYTIWKTLNIKNSIEAYLIIMYSYYKLEDFHFPINKFCINGVYDIITETNIIKIINIYLI